jgi:hypothetical protein
VHVVGQELVLRGRDAAAAAEDRVVVARVALLKPPTIAEATPPMRRLLEPDTKLLDPLSALL